MARDLRELLAEAKLRIQRRWPTMLLVEKPLTVSESSGVPGEPNRVLKEVVAIAAQDIDAGVQFVAIVAEKFGDVGEHRALAAAADELLKVGSGVLIKSGSAFDPHGQQTSSADLITSKVLYIHTDRLGVGVKEVQAVFADARFTPIIRDDAYWAAHDENRPPELFICHDSADKDAFVRPFADALSRKLVKVWYDENSLRPGDSLVESIEKGLQRSRYAVLVVSKAFLANKKWASREFRSLVTRDISEQRRLIVPIWLGVDHGAVAAYSLDLADRVAVVVSSATSPEDVADQLIRALRLTVPDLGERY